MKMIFLTLRKHEYCLRTAIPDWIFELSIKLEKMLNEDIANYNNTITLVIYDLDYNEDRSGYNFTLSSNVGNIEGFVTDEYLDLSWFEDAEIIFRKNRYSEEDKTNLNWIIEHLLESKKMSNNFTIEYKVFKHNVKHHL